MESGLDVRQTSDSLTLRAVSRFPRSEILRVQAVFMRLASCISTYFRTLQFHGSKPRTALMLDYESPEMHLQPHDAARITACDSSSCRNVASTSSADSS